MVKQPGTAPLSKMRMRSGIEPNLPTVRIDSAWL